MFGGMGVVDAVRARSRTTSRRIDGRRGWLFARGDGGAVTWMTVLKARRNCLAERFSGNTWMDVKFEGFKARSEVTYCEEVLDVEGEVLGSQFCVVGNSKDDECQAVSCLEDFKEQAVGTGCKVWESS